MCNECDYHVLPHTTRFAAKVGVKMMTFDNEVELHKIKHCFPSAELVIRIIADDPTATCNVRIQLLHVFNLTCYYSKWLHYYHCVDGGKKFLSNF